MAHRFAVKTTDYGSGHEGFSLFYQLSWAAVYSNGRGRPSNRGHLMNKSYLDKPALELDPWQTDEQSAKPLPVRVGLRKTVWLASLCGRSKQY